MSTELLAGGQAAATPERTPPGRPVGASAPAVARRSQRPSWSRPLWADQWEQQRELDRMTTAMASGEAQISTTDRYFDGVVAYYSPVIFRAKPPTGPARRVSRPTSVKARRTGMTGIATTSDELDGITILPWHRHLLAARSAYEARIALWQGFLTHTTTDAGALFDPVPGFEESATATTAALQLAVPGLGDCHRPGARHGSAPSAADPPTHQGLGS